MGYGESPTRWTVNTIDAQGNPEFDLQVGDILEFTGDGDGGSLSVTRRHRRGSPSIDWGYKCSYNAKYPAIKGVYNASAVEHVFSIFIELGTITTVARHTGSINPKGTWTAVEGD
jgi:hypothetical protein